MARLVFSKVMDKYPNLKIITHHFGGIVPMLEGRIGPGWDQLGARTSDEDLSVILKQLKSVRSIISSTRSMPTPPCSAACRRPMRGWRSTTSTRLYSRRTARSIREGHDVHARNDAHP
jgi:hypothetical protein